MKRATMTAALVLAGAAGWAIGEAVNAQGGAVSHLTASADSAGTGTAGAIAAEWIGTGDPGGESSNAQGATVFVGQFDPLQRSTPPAPSSTWMVY